MGNASRSLLALSMLAVASIPFFPGVAGFALDPRRRLGGRPSSKRPKTVVLTNKDFTHGTYITKNNTRYRLGEDIIFDPNVEFDSWPECSAAARRFKGQEKYCSGDAAKAYRLGFFAAIVMTGQSVHLDMAGHSMVQSVRHNLQQRFFSLIELADQPFIPSAGPASCDDKASKLFLFKGNADARSKQAVKHFLRQGKGKPAADDFCTSCKFGCGLNPCVRCSIRNGKLGLSSHHGIHGNNAERVVISNVDISNFEVAGISLNKCSGAALTNVRVHDQRRDIPVRATYSAGRYMLKFMDVMLARYPHSIGKAAQADIRAKCEPLRKVQTTVLRDVLATGQIHPRNIVGIKEFQLSLARPPKDGAPGLERYQWWDYARTRASDGNSYGIAFHNTGPMVGDFQSEVNQDDQTEGIVLRNVTIERIIANINEVVSTRNTAGTAEVDVAGGTLRVEEIFKRNVWTGKFLSPLQYARDSLHDCRFAFAHWSDAKFGNDRFMVRARGTRHMGTFSIDGATAAWARDPKHNPWPKHPEDFVCNMDSMNHRQKGTVGLFIQQARKVRIQNLLVRQITNLGELGSSMCGVYHNAVGASEDTASTHVGYTGSQSRGIALTTSNRVSFQHAAVHHVVSQNSHAYGVEVFNDVDSVDLNQVAVFDVRVLEKRFDADAQPRAEALVFGRGVRNVKMKRYSGHLVVSRKKEAIAKAVAAVAAIAKAVAAKQAAEEEAAATNKAGR